MRCYLFTSSCALAAIAFVSFLGNCTPVAGDLDPDSKAEVGLYYESLCGDSINWIKNVLKPSYDKIKDGVNFTFVPYGKASQSRDSETGLWTFSCQHGPAECDGNLAQSCAIHVIQNEEPAEKVQHLTASLVICVMTSKYPPSAVPKCAEAVGLSQVSQSKIRECISSPLGKDLLAANGDRTAALSPPLSFVPTITINGVVNWNLYQNRVFNDFTNLLCEEVGKGKLAYCSA